MYPGEYPQPLIRRMVVQCPVVSGYVTARLQAQDNINPPATSGPPSGLAVIFENVGNTAFSVLLRETDDRSVSGTRYTLPTAIGSFPAYVIPGGYVPMACDSSKQFLEVFCTGTTTGQLRMQIDSLRRWTEMGFGKDDPFYPPQLFQAKTVPGPLT